MKLIRWCREAASAIVEMKETWAHLVPHKGTSSYEGIAKFFGACSALMSQQMRGMVMGTLENIRDLFDKYQVNLSGQY